MREVVVDTETTGLYFDKGDRVIEVGAIELVDRQITGRRFHSYVCPQRPIERAAFAIHGLSEEFLADKPVFSAIADTLFAFLKGAQLVIHNAPFDIGFLDSEFRRLNKPFPSVRSSCTILDTLLLARKKHPGVKNSLDALCRRYNISLAARDKHGALLDATLLAHVYLAMTAAGQTTWFSPSSNSVQDAIHGMPFGTSSASVQAAACAAPSERVLTIVRATAEELDAHTNLLMFIAQESDSCLWDMDDRP